MSAPILESHCGQENNHRFPILNQKSQTELEEQLFLSPPSDVSCPASIPSQKQRRTAVLWKCNESRRATSSSFRREQAKHEIYSSHLASTSRLEHTSIPVYGCIKSFCAGSLDSQTRCFIGDDNGWLYTGTRLPGFDSLSFWAAELNLQPFSEISSICVSGSRCVATCSGSSTRISVQDLGDQGLTSILNLKGIQNVRASHLQGNTLLLGMLSCASKKAAYLRDIDATPSVQLLDTQSDVFTVHQHENLAYTGAQNGTITRFDVRMDEPYGEKLFDDRLEKRPRSSVVHINVIRNSQLLVSHMNGDLNTFDLRFCRQGTPLMNFPGHVNSLTRTLGIAVDPTEDFIFAAGEDCRIRGWSLRTASPLQSTQNAGPPEPWNDKSNPFGSVFAHPITTIQVTDEREGMCLWACSSGDLYKYYLGQRAC